MPDRQSATTHIAQQAFRYGAVTGAGLVLDLGLLWMLHAVLGVPLAVAAAMAVVAAGAVNYVLHEHWTFGSDLTRPRVSALRAGKYAGVVATTAVVRSAVVALLGAATTLNALSIVSVAFMVSYIVGFTLSRTLVFSWKRTVGG